MKGREEGQELAINQLITPDDQTNKTHVDELVVTIYILIPQ